MNGHEVAAHLGMSDSYWAAVRDLFPKEAQHTASTADDIAEAHADKATAGTVRGLTHNQLSDPLAGAHYARGVHCFVSGNQNKFLDTARQCRLN